MFLSPLISVAVKMAADSLTEQFCRMRGMDKNRRKLHRQLLAIQQKIADAEEHGEEWWLKELEAPAHAAVDVLDEFQYEALRRNAISQQPGCSATEGLAELTNLTELRRLELSDCTKWRAWPENMEHLPSLEYLEIQNCPEIESFPEGVQRRLPSLQVLWILDCPALGRRCISGGDYWHLVSPIPYRRIEIEESN